MSKILYTGGAVAREEKRAWVLLLVTLVSYGAYITFLLGRDAPLRDVTYVPALLWTFGGAALAAILLSILVSVGSPESQGRPDERDVRIKLVGDYIGNSLFVLGGGAALIMSMAELDHFWISNTIYFAFVLSVVIGATVKIVGYRQGFEQW